MKKTLKYHYCLWILIWILIIGAAVVDIFESSSILDILTIILGISMIYYNYNYRNMTPKNGKNGDIPHGQI
jgi:hypothetical protein